ncbi:MAG: electron transport complex subunit E [Bacteroidales bacterium]|jgi:electron transport complex protein RnfE|nr:electron transport complex subunit E [Bacteroidales bacterium]
MSNIKIFTNGLIKENPTLVLLIGMCPTLGVSTSAINGVGMGLATTFVLIMSNVFISALKSFIPDNVRIPAFVVVIAAFVSVVDMLMAGYMPALHAQLGVFIPLIVVNCIILARAEAFAAKNNIFKSFLDGAGMGLGFTCALTLLGTIREMLGNGAVFGFKLTQGDAILLCILPAGGFIILGLLIALINHIKEQRVKTTSLKE